MAEPLQSPRAMLSEGTYAASIIFFAKAIASFNVLYPKLAEFLLLNFYFEFSLELVFFLQYFFRKTNWMDVILF